jgi:hypothetical protein
MSVQMSGPEPLTGYLSPAVVRAALATPHPDSRRRTGWMRRRGLRPVTAPHLASGGEVCIEAEQDFVQCHHPGCCALRPLHGQAECQICGRR